MSFIELLQGEMRADLFELIGDLAELFGDVTGAAVAETGGVLDEAEVHEGAGFGFALADSGAA